MSENQDQEYRLYIIDPLFCKTHWRSSGIPPLRYSETRGTSIACAWRRSSLYSWESLVFSVNQLPIVPTFLLYPFQLWHAGRSADWVRIPTVIQCRASGFGWHRCLFPSSAWAVRTSHMPAGRDHRNRWSDRGNALDICCKSRVCLSSHSSLSIRRDS